MLMLHPSGNWRRCHLNSNCCSPRITSLSLSPVIFHTYWTQFSKYVTDRQNLCRRTASGSISSKHSRFSWHNEGSQNSRRGAAIERLELPLETKRPPGNLGDLFFQGRIVPTEV